MANVDVYDAVTMASGVPNGSGKLQSRSMFDGKKVKKVNLSCSSPFVKCMNLHWNICSGNVRLRELVRLKLQFKA